MRRAPKFNEIDCPVFGHPLASRMANNLCRLFRVAAGNGRIDGYAVRGYRPSPEREGVMSKGLVRCPCGLPEAVICAHCSRSVCSEHHAYTPTGGDHLDFACFPRCTAPWWRQFESTTSAYIAKVAEDEDERRTLVHAVALLERGGDVRAVAAEMGVHEHRVRALARRIRQRRS